MEFYKIRTLLIIFFFSILSTNADTIATIPIKPQQVTIACWKYNKPYSYIREDEQPAGIFIDIWENWSQKTNIKVKFKFYETLDQTVDAVIKNKADIHSGLRITDYRSKYLHFAKRSFFPGRLAIFYASYKTPVTFKNLYKKKLGVIKHSFAHDFIHKNYKDIEIETFYSRKEMTEAVLAGKIRAFISNEPCVLQYIKKQHLNGSIKKTPGYSLNKNFHIAINPRNKFLLKFIYNGLNKLHYTNYLNIESKYILNPTSRYFSHGKSSIELNNKEKVWLKKQKQIIVGYNPHNHPVEFTNEKGEFSGITKEILENIEKEISIKFLYKELPTAKVKNLKNDYIYDVLISSTLSIHDSINIYEKTSSFANLDIVSAIKSSNSKVSYLNFENKIIACNNPFVYNFIKNLYQNNQIIKVNSAKEGLKILLNNHADIFIGDVPTIKYAISELQTNDIEINYETIITQDLFFYLSNDNHILKTILNKAIVSLDSHNTEQIVNKWSNITIKEKVDWKLFIAIGGPIALFALVTFILYFLRAKEIKKRTQVQNELISAQKQLVATNYRITKFWRNISNKMTSAFLHIGFKISPEKTITETQIININSKFEDLTSVKRKDIINSKADYILNKLSIEIKENLLEAIINKKEYRFDTFNNLLEKHLDFLVIPIDTNQIVILITDITEKKQNEITILEAQKMESIAQLAGSIAHDFNNQLMGILGYSNLLKDQLKDPELKNYASIITEGAKKSAGLTNQLLAFSRKGKYRNVTVNINTTLSKVIKLFKDKNPNINIKLNANAIKHNVSGEPRLIHNAFLNIIINSFEAIPEDGYIEITTYNSTKDLFNTTPNEEDSNEYIIIEIADNGPGIDSDTISKVFEPFYSTKDTGVGQGLGLPAARGAILSHNGNIKVENLPETGCKFCIQLPIIKTGSRLNHKPVVQRKQNNTNDKTNILIVDDEEIVRSIVKDMLINSNHNAITFSNGIDAINYYNDNYSKIDLVLLDIIMPEMSGKEVYFNLKKINPDVNVIIFSGYTMDNTIQELLDKGVKDFIHKPVNRAKLLEKISNILGHASPKEKSETEKELPENSLDKLKSSFTDTDIENALKNLGNDLALYIKLISRFYDKYPDLINDLRKSLKDDSEAAYIIVHSLKSLAATLGRFKLQNAAIQMEKVIQNKEDTSFHLEIFENEFMSFMKEIKDFLNK